MTKQKLILPVAALLTATILWGANSTFIKIGVEAIPAPIFMAVRFLIVSLVFLPLALRHWVPLTRKQVLLFCVSSFFFMCLSGLALNVGLSKTTANNAAIISLLEPILLSILSYKVLREKVSLRFVSGLLLASVGAVVVIGRSPELGGQEMLVGDLLVMISVVFLVVSVLISKSLVKNIGAYQATFMNIFPGIVPISIYALYITPTVDFGAISTNSWWALLWSTLAVLGANVCFYYGLRRKQAAETGVYQYLGALATVLSAWFLLGERPNSQFIIGAILVCAGLYIAEFSKFRSHTKKTKRAMVKRE